MFDKKFLTAAAERAIKTFVQTLLALVGTDSMGLINADLTASLQVAASAALLSVLTSFSSAGAGKNGPSLAGETTDEPRIITVERVVEKFVPAPADAAAPKKTTKKAAPKKPSA